MFYRRLACRCLHTKRGLISWCVVCLGAGGRFLVSVHVWKWVTCGGGRHSPRAGSHVTHVDLSSYQVLCGSELHVGGCSAGGNLLGPGHMSHMWTRLVLIINPVWLQLMRNVHHTLGKTSSSSDLCGHHVSHFFKKTFLLIGILLNRLHRSDPPMATLLFHRLMVSSLKHPGAIYG